MRLGIIGFFSTLFLILSACSNLSKPDCLITKDKLALILTDLHIAEKKLDYAGLSKDSAYAVYHGVYKKNILDSAGTTVDCFEASMDYYVAHPLEIESIYKTVVDTLVKRNTRLDLLEKQAEGVVKQ